MKVPFVDLKNQYLTIKSEIDRAIQAVINDTAFINGKYVQEFEEKFADKYDAKHCISVASGTDAIYITLKCLGVGPGDEVITVANSWISTSETITQVGAKPVFVDIEPDYFTIDPSQIDQKISPRTKAILPVHLFGQPANINEIENICNKHQLYLIEDCAQAHFATFDGQKVGKFGIAGIFSFYPGKNLGAYGDAGAIITDDDELATKIRMFANHGALKKHDHKIEGINSRMDGLQAAILSVKLPHIDEWNARRLQNALLYNELLSNIENVQTPKIRHNVKHIFHLYVIRVKQRDELIDFLKQREISTGIHYPTALPFLAAYSYLNHSEEEFPIAYDYQSKILSLPMFPELKKEQIEYVVKSIEEYFSI